MLALSAAFVLAVPAAARAQSTTSAPVPLAATSKSEAFAAFVAPPQVVPATVVALAPIDSGAIAAAKSANSKLSRKRLQVGVGRDVHGHREAHSDALQWRELGAGHVARWEIVSPGAEALRIELSADTLPPGTELRFSGSGDATVYGPFTAADFISGGGTLWSPVLEGEVATAEMRVPSGAPRLPMSLAITRVSHHFVSMRDSRAEVQAKDIGDSGGCSQDLICSSAGEPELANLGKAVARMTFVENGQGYLCTGTLIQSMNGTATPYFYSAAHCIDTPQVASTLTTHWFFDRAGCNSGSTSPSYVQRTGGAALLYADATSDVLLLQLNAAPPAGAWFAGWDAAPLATTDGVAAIHHPRGDWKKISFGMVLGFEAPLAQYGSMIRVTWNNGVTEGGSSGSGLFSNFKLRGGLWGGASYCGAPPNLMYDFYSRLDQAYPSIRQWIDPVGAAKTLTLTKAGSGTGIVTSSPIGLNCGSTCAASFPNGFLVTLTATPNHPATFTGWSGACSGSALQCTVTMDAAKSVTATFGPPGVMLFVNKQGSGTGTVSSTPAGISCGTTCSGTFAAGAAVTLTATPSGGSSFSGWSGACSGTGACTVTMDAQKIVGVAFNPPGVLLSVSKTGSGSGTVTSSQGGINCGATCSVELSTNQGVTLNAAASSGSVFTGWSGACSGIQPCTLTMDAAKAAIASFAMDPRPVVVDVSTAAIAFGAQSMGTTSPASPVVVTNVGANTVIFSGIGTNNAQFGQAGNCTNIAPGTSCTLNATFTPAVTGIALGQSSPVAGQLSIPSNAAGSPHLVALSGSAEKSLVTHYYRSILRRAPDAGGKAFWESEAQRLVGLGISVNEAWYAMAMSFYGSAEYAAFNRSSPDFVTDLYTTFFNRAPDGAGHSYWNNEVVNGLPRGVALASFMFSAEFRGFSNALFGSAGVRPEVDAVVDFYRGLLGRLPDSGGFTYWLQRFRAAQCAGQAQVLAEVEGISGAFANGAEYTARARSVPNFVGDLYNAFLRRGGDLLGVQYWMNQVGGGAQTRDQARIQFKNSAEFQARVTAILAAPCLP